MVEAICDISETMSGGLMAQAPVTTPEIESRYTNYSNLLPSPGLSLTLAGGLEGQGHNCYKFPDQLYEQRANTDEDQYESSENMEGESADHEQDINYAEDSNPRRRKRYHRHTPQQIQEMEALFKESPHPDEKQRQKLSRHLGLAPRQVKFWFQNRRTQLKAMQERQENSVLRHEIEKLRAENMSFREAMRNSVCSSCGGPGTLVAEIMSYEEQKLRTENARLKDQLEKVCSFVAKLYGRHNPSSITSLSAPAMPNSTPLDLEVGLNKSLGGLMNSAEARDVPLTSSDRECSADARNRSAALMGIERSRIAELAMKAMAELMKISRMEEPLWVPSFQGGKESLDNEEYSREFPRVIGPKPIGHKTEATRESAVVLIKGSNLVGALLNVNRWKQMFSGIVSNATTLDVISYGVGDTRNGALQLMYAELQVISPLVPWREIYFVRYCKQHGEGLWAVVDVSVDSLLENPHPSFIKCRKRPSGCLIQDMANGHSKVTWVEHTEYDNLGVHRLYRSVVNSGMAFGAHRWVATLQRQCEQIAFLMTTNMLATEPAAVPTASGRRSMLELADRMIKNFYRAVNASTEQAWNEVSARDDVRVITRKNAEEPGEPPGVILSAATSLWLPVSPHRLFNFLRDEKLRSKWDILSSGGPIQERACIAKGQGHGNRVSLLSATDADQSNMLILQESCSDDSGSMVVYAPVDIPAMELVMNGGDSANVALLPSGFSILPDGPECSTLDDLPAKSRGGTGSPQVGGSLLTVAFQILVNSLATSRLTMESVEIINNLISCTVQKIKSALQCEDA